MAKDIVLPMDKGEWKECRIIEDRGEHDEHDDQFYRYESFGIEACRHGMPDMEPEYEPYVIVDDVPYKMEGYHRSFEEAVGAIMHAMGAKRVDGGKWDEEEEDGKDDEDDDGDRDEKGSMTIELEEISKSSISDMISRRREDRKAPAKVDLDRDGPVIGGSEMRTTRFPGRTLHIGEGRNPALPKSIEVHDGAEGSSHKRV